MDDNRSPSLSEMKTVTLRTMLKDIWGRIYETEEQMSRKDSDTRTALKKGRE
jgi:hypothetical protein